MKILVTGAAGFIGFKTAQQLLERGDTVVGLDNFNDYYDVALKEARAAILDGYDAFSMRRTVSCRIWGRSISTMTWYSSGTAPPRACACPTATGSRTIVPA